MALATRHVGIASSKAEDGAQSTSLFGQWFERGLRIIISVLVGVVASALAFELGVSKFVGLCIGAAVVGLVLALLKGFDQGPTTT